MIRGSTKFVEKKPFSKKLPGSTVPVNFERKVIEESRAGVMRQFYRDQYLFQWAPENSEAREEQRMKLKKLRRIAKDLNKMLRMTL